MQMNKKDKDWEKLSHAKYIFLNLILILVQLNEQPYATYVNVNNIKMFTITVSRRTLQDQRRWTYTALIGYEWPRNRLWKLHLLVITPVSSANTCIFARPIDGKILIVVISKL